jgi:hypothetical protein
MKMLDHINEKKDDLMLLLLKRTSVRLHSPDNVLLECFPDGTVARIVSEKEANRTLNDKNKHGWSIIECRKEIYKFFVDGAYRPNQ